MVSDTTRELFKPEVEEILSKIINPNLIIGVIAPTGINKKLAIDEITKTLKTCGYNAVVVKPMEILAKIYRYRSIGKGNLELTHPHEEDRIIELMNAGDHFREHVSTNALALLTIDEIAKLRKTAKRTVFIIDSIKHPDELSAFRNVYDRYLISISVDIKRPEKVKQLAKKIATKRNDTEDVTKYNSIAETIINRDENDAEKPYGQKFRDTYPLADIFIDLSDDVPRQCKRIIELWFTNPDITPTIEEYGMYLAHAAALKSADLSRQVGAVILSSKGSILASGFNEVPKPKGGAFWNDEEIDPPDCRDMIKMEDPNQTIKDEAIRELIEELKELDILKSKIPISNIISQLSSRDEVKSIRLFSLIEFGRIVHAEMNAITDAARRGVSTDDAILICTTFPCHLCAKHIISAGISKVVFIEPYPKSLSNQLYDDLISFEKSNGKVWFKPFHGVSPLRFFDFFKRHKRKDKSGKKLEWKSEISQPIFKSAAEDPILIGETRAQNILRMVSIESIGNDPKNDSHPYSPTKPRGKK